MMYIGYAASMKSGNHAFRKSMERAERIRIGRGLLMVEYPDDFSVSARISIIPEGNSRIWCPGGWRERRNRRISSISLTQYRGGKSREVITHKVMMVNISNQYGPNILTQCCSEHSPCLKTEYKNKEQTEHCRNQGTYNPVNSY